MSYGRIREIGLFKIGGMSMYEVFYIGTKKYDINIIISCNKRNYIAYGIEKSKNKIEFHLHKLHIRISRYGVEKI